jgi:hypothetical protein
MCGLRLSLGIGCMLLGVDVIALGMLLSCGPMRLGGLIMLVSRFFMHFLWHEITPLSGGLKVRMTEASQQASAYHSHPGWPGGALRVGLRCCRENRYRDDHGPCLSSRGEAKGITGSAICAVRIPGERGDVI